MTSINELAERAYNIAVRRHKIHRDVVLHTDTIASLAEEFSEFILANEFLLSDHIEHVSQAVEELTDILIVCMSELHRRNINLEDMIIAKTEFNEKR